MPERSTRAVLRSQYQARRRARISEWLLDYKKTTGCERCGDKDPARLTFHHRNPSEKRMTVSSARVKSWTFVRAEVAKCQVLCIKCHRRVHRIDLDRIHA